MKFQKILVTPSIARQYLEQNTRNRRVKKNRVETYSQEMINGNWKEDTAETIKVSKTGVVLDGQHRLLAVIKSKKTIFFHFAVGLEDSVFDVIDTGANRSGSDCFKIERIGHSNILPSVISVKMLLENKKINIPGGGSKVPNNELLKIYFKREQFWQNVAVKTMGWYNSFAKILPPSLVGGFYAVFHDINNEKANDFMSQLCTGLDVTNNTICLLRNKLMKDKMSFSKMTIQMKQALIIKTWNLYVEGRSVKKLSFDSNKEKYPQPTR